MLNVHVYYFYIIQSIHTTRILQKYILEYVDLDLHALPLRSTVLDSPDLNQLTSNFGGERSRLLEVLRADAA